MAGRSCGGGQFVGGATRERRETALDRVATPVPSPGGVFDRSEVVGRRAPTPARDATPPHGNSRRSLRHPTRLNRRLTNHGSVRLRHRQSPRPRRPAGRIARGEGCTHFRTLKSGSCRIFSHDPMPCFCTASRSACSSSSSQYPRKGIVLWLCRRTRTAVDAPARGGTLWGYRAVRPSVCARASVSASRPASWAFPTVRAPHSARPRIGLRPPSEKARRRREFTTAVRITFTFRYEGRFYPRFSILRMILRYTLILVNTVNKP